METLLAIDDEPLILECFRQGFAGSDVRVLTAPTAVEGLELFSRFHPDAVCLDINLPDLNGLDTIGRIRELNPKAPVIVMTGAGTTATAIQATALGAYDYLPKPFDFHRLQTTVSRALETARLMQTPAVVQNCSEPIEKADVLVGKWHCVPLTADRITKRFRTEDLM